MYSKIEIHNTENPKKYLFIKDDNILFGGFIIKDIIEMLKNNLSSNEITKNLSEKYKTNIEQDNIQKIIDNDIKNLVEKPKKRKILKILKLSIPKNLKFPNFVYYIFNYGIFYSLLLITMIINSVFFFTNDEFSLELTNNERVYSFFILMIIFAFHELGHIISSKFDDINVKETGLALYFIFPILYVNLNESWKLERKKKIRINLSGIYFQSIIGAIIVLLFHYTEIKASILWYLFLANYIVILLNLNPFFLFDGYWILSDLLKENNLKNQSSKYLKSFFKKDAIQYTGKIKIYAFSKLIFFILFIPIVAYKFYLHIYPFIQTSESKTLYIIGGIITTLIILNIINKQNGFRKSTTIN